MAQPETSRCLGGELDYFPHLPQYSPPTTGLISLFPSSCIPYAQLMRLDRPAGFYAFYFPYVIGTLYAACISPTSPSVATILQLLTYLVPFTIILRGAACTWNDTVDQDFDRRVERCRHRPIARGAVSTLHGHTFTLFLLLAQNVMSNLFPAPCKLHLVFMVLLFFIYALLKRVTYYPQVFLGFPFAWAIFFSMASAGLEPFQHQSLVPTLALFLANIIWTITYDTIYAHQDIADDENAGVKSMALRFRSNTKRLAGFLCVCQLTLLAICGIWARFGLVYFIGTVGGVGVATAYYIYSVDLGQPMSCGLWFHRQFWLVGMGYVAGLSGQYALRQR